MIHPSSSRPEPAFSLYLAWWRRGLSVGPRFFGIEEEEEVEEVEEEEEEEEGRVINISAGAR